LVWLWDWLMGRSSSRCLCLRGFGAGRMTELHGVTTFLESANHRLRGSPGSNATHSRLYRRSTRQGHPLTAFGWSLRSRLLRQSYPDAWVRAGHYPVPLVRGAALASASRVGCFRRRPFQYSWLLGASGVGHRSSVRRAGRSTRVSHRQRHLADVWQCSIREALVTHPPELCQERWLSRSEDAVQVLTFDKRSGLELQAAVPVIRADDRSRIARISSHISNHIEPVDRRAGHAGGGPIRKDSALAPQAGVDGSGHRGKERPHCVVKGGSRRREHDQMNVI
jgi:hypothetical protein